MDAPPPVPRPRLSPSLLIAIFLVLLAVLARTVLSGIDEADRLPWQRLALAIAGIVAAAAALVLSIVAFFGRPRAWPLSIFVCLASVGIIWFLVPELGQPFAGVISQVQRGSTEGVALAQRPIPQEKDAPTAALVQPSLVAWGEEAMVGPYREHGHYDAAWDDAAQQLIRGTALELAGSPASPGVERLRALAAEIQRTECDDPWVLYLIRRLGDEDPDYAESMGRAATAVAKAGYPPFPIWLARATALQAARRDEPGGVTIDGGALLGLGSTAGGEGTIQFRKLEWRTPGKEN